MRILIAAGGTGGHVYPALAVLRCLRERRPDAEFRWLGGHRGLEREIVPAAGERLDLLWLRSLRTVELSVHTLLDPLRLAAAIPQAGAIIAGWRPQLLFTTGGYVAIPVLAAAAALRVPSLMWEGNLVAGRSVRASARLASALAVSFAETCEQLPGRCYQTGTPIRTLGPGDRATARARLGLPAGPPLMFVFGGSQAVRRLNDAVAEVLPALVGQVVLLHVCGAAELAAAQGRRAELPASLRERYLPSAFLGDEMAYALVAADLLVGRAGSSTLAEASAAGLPMVVVPYPHASAHQLENARALDEAGAARIVADADFDGDALLDAARLLADEAVLEAMRAAARGFGRPGAAQAVAELALALAERRPLPERGQIEQLSRAAA
jgi:UDP-N-acetylglucosamine--N-acetylmuramyl-(pentapeptide) pyrophosphoryl-undecaprenol N-acetylglucosamine transferase